MITQHQNVYIRKDLEPIGLKIILPGIFNEIKNELNRIEKSYYSYKFDEDEFCGTDNVFRFIERTWVGVLNNSLIRVHSDITTLQEFSVWSTERNIGRCDFLFRHHYSEKPDDFVTEAKVWEFTNNWKFPTPRNFYSGIFNQAYNYYSAEEKYYKSYQSNLWLFAFVAEWIRDENMLKAAVNIMDGWHDNTDSETDFITLYQGIRRGAFVYGKIVSIAEFQEWLKATVTAQTFFGLEGDNCE